MKTYGSDGTDFDQVFAEPTSTLMMILIWHWHKSNQYQINKVPKERSEVQYYLFHLMKSKLGFKKAPLSNCSLGISHHDSTSQLASKVRKVANEEEQYASEVVFWSSASYELITTNGRLCFNF